MNDSPKTLQCGFCSFISEDKKEVLKHWDVCRERLNLNDLMELDMSIRVMKNE